MDSTNLVKIAWFGKHFGEEPPLVGEAGAGGVFFTGCNLRCVYCQNYQISQQGMGKDYTLEEFAEIMLDLQNQGALDIDLVTPTIWAERIKKAVKIAKAQGLTIPIIWNSNAYESVEMIRGLEGVVDIYLPDFKYGDDELALKYSGVNDYVEKAKEAIEEMLKQVGHLQTSEQGIAKKGIIVRHMILPNNIENSFKVLGYLHEIDKNIYIHLMAQYGPMNRASEFPELNRTITQKELDQVFERLVALEF
ncbi:MAG: radical SAM protein, partial [bacterium]|nr:radical SAM protein [bacterium]